MKKLLFLALTFCLFFSSAFATTLETIFEDNFYTLHVPNRCGQNIMNFLKLAQKENIDLSTAEIINVQHGWVEPQYVRNQGYSPKAPGPAGLIHEPGKRYFQFHVFLLHENKVYDFDYGNRPVIPSLQTYLKKMWIKGKEADRFLGVNIYPAKDYLSGKPIPTNPKYVPLLQLPHRKP